MNRPRTTLLFSLALLSGCGGVGAPGRTPAETDPSLPIRVAPGEDFRLVLDSNESTGYRWMLTDSAGLRSVRLLRRRYVQGPGEGDGAGGTEYWTFRAEQPGEEAITLAYRRPWEQIPPVETRQFRVGVR